jgi:phospholipid/cholesterol/gamma-HCH transport system permease protein
MRHENNTRPGITGLKGGKVREKFRNALEFYLFSTAVLIKIFHISRQKRIGKTVLFRQIMFTGFDALPVIAVISLGISALTILEVNQLTGKLGENRLVYELLVVIVLRQVSILFTAFVLIARSGAAISTELGNMVVNKEIDLLNSFGISLFDYLVAPRVIGVVVSLFTLTLYFNFIAVLGGFLFFNVIYSQVSFGYFMSRIIRELSFLDFFIPVIKSILFGLAIGLMSCYQGLKVRRASTEVPQRTIRSVVDSVASIIMLNIVVTILFYI